MQNNILYMLFICFFFFSCEKKQLSKTNFDSLGIHIEDYNRIDTVFYDSGKTKSIRLYKSDSEFADLNFYESGNKKSIGKVKNNQCHDEYIDWYENGKKKAIRKYDVGIQIGKSLSFQENGNLDQEFDNDSKQHTDYWENGKTKFKFIENSFKSYHYYNGNVMEKYSYTNDETKEYKVEYFHENGNLEFSGKYVKDALFKDDVKYNGEIICYFDNGEISLYQNMFAGKPIGKSYSHYGNGNLKSEIETRNGKEVYFKAYYENGSLNFIRDRKTGTYTQWDEKGKLQEQEKL